jgi:hypothetical protein
MLYDLRHRQIKCTIKYACIALLGLKIRSLQRICIIDRVLLAEYCQVDTSENSEHLGS